MHGGVQICQPGSELFFEVLVGDEHEVDCVEVRGLPLDISGICSAQYVFFLFMVENESVVLVLQTPNVPLEQEFNHVELVVRQAEKVLQLNGHLRTRTAQHLVAVQELLGLLQPAPQWHAHYTSPQVYQYVENEVLEVSASSGVLFDQFPIENLDHPSSPAAFRDVDIERDVDVDHTNVQGGVAPATDKVAFCNALVGTLFGKSPNCVCPVDPGHHQQIPYSVAFLADEVGRDTVRGQFENFLAGVAGDGDGVSPEEDLPSSKRGEEVPELAHDVVRKCTGDSWFFEADFPFIAGVAAPFCQLLLHQLQPQQIYRLDPDSVHFQKHFFLHANQHHQQLQHLLRRHNSYPQYLLKFTPKQRNPGLHNQSERETASSKLQMQFFNKYRDLFGVPQGLGVPSSRLQLSNELFIEKTYIPTKTQEYSLNSKLRELRKDYHQFEASIDEITKMRQTPKRTSSRKGNDGSRLISPSVYQKYNENKESRGSLTLPPQHPSPKYDPALDKKKLNEERRKHEQWLKNEHTDILKHSQLDHIFSNKLNKVYDLEDIKTHTLPKPEIDMGMPLEPRKPKHQFNIKQRSRPQLEGRQSTDRSGPAEGARGRREKAKSNLQFRRKKLQQLLRTLW